MCYFCLLKSKALLDIFMHIYCKVTLIISVIGAKVLIRSDVMTCIDNPSCLYVC